MHTRYNKHFHHPHSSSLIHAHSILLFVPATSQVIKFNHRMQMNVFDDGNVLKRLRRSTGGHGSSWYVVLSFLPFPSLRSSFFLFIPRVLLSLLLYSLKVFFNYGIYSSVASRELTRSFALTGCIILSYFDSFYLLCSLF